MCFYGFDNYVLSDFRCVNIILVRDLPVYWMDNRNFASSGLSNALFQGDVPTNNTHFVLPVGQLFELRLQARQLSEGSPEAIDIYITQV